MSERVYDLISPTQLVEILAMVHKDHLWPMDGRRIKYVDIHYDNRSSDCFTIVFRHGGGNAKQTMFTSVNRFDKELKMEDVRLYDEIVEWLDGGKTLESP